MRAFLGVTSATKYKMVEFWEKYHPPRNNPNRKAFLSVQKAVEEKLILLKFEVFSFAASILEPYLLAYQTDKPTILFMCSDLERLLRNILNLFVKQEVVDKCSTPIQLKEIDIHKKDNLLKGKKHQTGLRS